MKKAFVGFILGLLFIVSLISPVLAIDNPDSVSIGDVYVFGNVVEPGDQLYFCRYDVSYNSTPDEDAEDTWQMAVYNNTGSLVASRPLNYYQHNIISIYFTSAQVTSKVLTWEGAHQIRIMGMPSVFGNLTEGINMRTRTLAASDYYTSSYLGGVMITQAEILEDDWEITLLNSSDRLNTTGTAFFLEAVPGLGSMAPEIFDVITGGVDVDYKAYNTTYRDTLAENQGDRLESGVRELSKAFGVYEPEWLDFFLVMLLTTMLTGILVAAGMSPGHAFGIGIGGGVGFLAYLFGGNIFTFFIVIGVVAAILFAIFVIMPKFT